MSESGSLDPVCTCGIEQPEPRYHSGTCPITEAWARRQEQRCMRPSIPVLDETLERSNPELSSSEACGACGKPISAHKWGVRRVEEGPICPVMVEDAPSSNSLFDELRSDIDTLVQEAINAGHPLGTSWPMDQVRKEVEAMLERLQRECSLAQQNERAMMRRLEELLAMRTIQTDSGSSQRLKEDSKLAVELREEAEDYRVEGTDDYFRMGVIMRSGADAIERLQREFEEVARLSHQYRNEAERLQSRVSIETIAGQGLKSISFEPRGHQVALVVCFDSLEHAQANRSRVTAALLDEKTNPDTICACGKRMGEHPAQPPWWPCMLAGKSAETVETPPESVLDPHILKFARRSAKGALRRGEEMTAINCEFLLAVLAAAEAFVFGSSEKSTDCSICSVGNPGVYIKNGRMVCPHRPEEKTNDDDLTVQFPRAWAPYLQAVILGALGDFDGDGDCRWHLNELAKFLGRAAEKTIDEACSCSVDQSNGNIIGDPCPACLAQKTRASEKTSEPWSAEVQEPVLSDGLTLSEGREKCEHGIPRRFCTAVHEESSIFAHKVTVCDKCLCASCWQGDFYCEAYKKAGTVEKTVGELHQGSARESCEYWFKEPDTGKTNEHLLERYWRAVNGEAGQ